MYRNTTKNILLQNIKLRMQLLIQKVKNLKTVVFVVGN